MTLIEQLKVQNGFSQTERAIADYILHNPNEVCRMSIAQLAAQSYTSNPAVVRLCRKVGLSGYREMRVELAGELERRRLLIANVDADAPFSPRESCATMMRSIAELTREATLSCYASLSPDVMDEVAQLVAEAPHVLLFGVGSSCVAAEALAEMLVKLSVDCIVAHHHGASFPRAYVAGPNDIALFITYSGKILDYVARDLRVLDERGCTTAIVTGLDDGDARLSGFDYVIHIPQRERPAGAIAPFYSQACITYVLNCIYGRVYALNFDENRSQKDEIDLTPYVGE